MSVSIDRRRDVWVDVAEAFADVGQGHARREQVRAVRMAQGEKAGVLWKLQAAEQQRNSRGE